METSELSRADKELIVKFSEYLDKFKASALKKFIEGRKEHNENILTIDCDKEIIQEQMDIIAYGFIKQQQNDITRDN